MLAAVLHSFNPRTQDSSMDILYPYEVPFYECPRVATCTNTRKPLFCGASCFRTDSHTCKQDHKSRSSGDSDGSFFMPKCMTYHQVYWCVITGHPVNDSLNLA